MGVTLQPRINEQGLLRPWPWRASLAPAAWELWQPTRWNGWVPREKDGHWTMKIWKSGNGETWELDSFEDNFRGLWTDVGCLSFFWGVLSDKKLMVHPWMDGICCRFLGHSQALAFGSFFSVLSLTFREWRIDAGRVFVARDVHCNPSIVDATIGWFQRCKPPFSML